MFDLKIILTKFREYLQPIIKDKLSKLINKNDYS